MRHTPFNRGNILFLILIAVALFAALSYVVVSSTRSGGGTITKEKASLVASEFMNYAVEMRAAIQRMVVQNGCSAEEINYSDPYFGTYYDNPNAPASKKCNIFAREGGGMSFRKINVRDGYAATPELIGSFRVAGMGTNEPELMLVLFLRNGVGDTKVNQEICSYIFKANKINIPLTLNDTVGAGSPFKGTYNAVDTIGDQVPALAKQDVGCWSGAPNQWYTTYVVLLQM